MRKSYYGKRPKNKAAFITLGTKVQPPPSSLRPSMNQTLPRVFNEKFSSHNRAWLACRDWGGWSWPHTEWPRYPNTGAMGAAPTGEGKEQELLFPVPAQLHTSEAGRSCPQHVLVCQKGVFTWCWACSTGAQKPQHLVLLLGHCGPWGDNSSALGSSTAQGHQRPSHGSHPHGTLGYHPSRTGSATASGIAWHIGFQEKGYKNSWQAYVFLEYLHKAWDQIKKPSISIIQNIVAVQDTINAAFIQIPTAWDCGHLNGENIYEKEWELCATQHQRVKQAIFFKENYLNHGCF